MGQRGGAAHRAMQRLVSRVARLGCGSALVPRTVQTEALSYSPCSLPGLHAADLLARRETHCSASTSCASGGGDAQPAPFWRSPPAAGRLPVPGSGVQGKQSLRAGRRGLASAAGGEAGDREGRSEGLGIASQLVCRQSHASSSKVEQERLQAAVTFQVPHACSHPPPGKARTSQRTHASPRACCAALCSCSGCSGPQA